MIIFAHLLNDRSGSPRILCSAIEALARDEFRSRLFVSSDGSGCLDEASIEVVRYWYWRTPFRLATLLTYLVSQFCLFFKLFFSKNIDGNALIYVNTLLPFGAALYGRMTGRPVVYHLHEISVNPAPLRCFLKAVARYTSCGLIYVSDFHRNCLPIPGVPSRTVYNALDIKFLKRARDSLYRHRHLDCFNVLMLASLRNYKGVPEFLMLAERLAERSDIHFNLVLNDDHGVIQRYFESIQLPSNITLYPRVRDPVIHYAQASLVLNLSRPDQWVETFGLTLLEAMAFGIPVIAPPVGGPVELISDGLEGFLIDSRNVTELSEKVLQLADDESLCLGLSNKARQKAARFTPEALETGLREALNFYTREKSVSQ